MIRVLAGKLGDVEPQKPNKGDIQWVEGSSEVK